MNGIQNIDGARPGSPLHKLATRLDQLPRRPVSPNSLASMLTERLGAEMDFQTFHLWKDRVAIIKDARSVLMQIGKLLERLEGAGTASRDGTLCLTYPFEPMVEELIDSAAVPDQAARRAKGLELINLLLRIPTIPIESKPPRRRKQISEAAIAVASVVRAYLRQHEHTDYRISGSNSAKRTRWNDDAFALLGGVLSMLALNDGPYPRKIAELVYNTEAQI